MNIIFFAPRFHTNQISVIDVLQKHGHKVEFLTFNTGKEIEDHTILKPIQLKESRIYTFLGRFFNNLKNYNTRRKYVLNSFTQLYFIIKNKHNNVFILRNFDTIPGLQVFIMLLIKKKLVIHYHQKPFFGVKSRRTKLINLSNKLFNTRSYTPSLGDIKNEKTIRKGNQYLPFPVFINKNVIPSRIQNFEPIKIITVAKFINRKKIDLLLLALSRVKENYILTIVGQITNDENNLYYLFIKNLIQELNLGNKVRIKIGLKYSLMLNEYSNNDLFILPSENEPFSISIPEAMGNGLALISSDSCGSRNYIIEGVNGFIFKTNDSNDLFQKINQTIKNIDEYKRNSLRLAELEFNESLFYEVFKQILINEN